MTSLLAFAWRRESAAQSNGGRVINVDTNMDDTNTSPVPPALSASRSGETIGEEEQYFQISRRYTPHTPEGLRSRKSLDSIREELQLPDPDNVSYSYSQRQSDYSFSVLPPRPSSSWSTTGVMSSPPVSTSSFYARGHDEHQRVAESPHLLPGKARTAVGALVALEHGSGTWNSYSNSFQRDFEPSKNRYDHHARMFEDWGKQNEVEYDCREDKNHEEDEDEISEPPYYALSEAASHPFHGDLILESRTPVRPLAKAMRTEQSLPQSPSSAYSSVEASPSSQTRFQPYSSRPMQSLTKSFSSSAALINKTSENSNPNRPYDFAPLVLPDRDRVTGSEVVVAEDPNVSIMSHSVLESTASPKSTVDYQEEPFETAMTVHYPLDAELLQRKVHNQRQLKEEIILAVLERLQDEVQLVADVEALPGSAASMDDWFVKTDLKQESVLTGYHTESRACIMRSISTIVNEMNLTTPEEFFLSPSQVPMYSGTHNDLRAALHFTRTLVHRAIPSTEANSCEQEGRWRLLPDLRTAFGLIDPESPEIVRGGDTSVFSLPSDSVETPMTSNVSITTTITTTKTGTPNNLKARVVRLSSNGLHLRRTIEIFATLLQKLSMECNKLRNVDATRWSLSAAETLRLADNLKQNYNHLMAMDVNNLKGLIDAFELDVTTFPPLHICREVSADSTTNETERMYLPPPPPSLTLLPPARTSRVRILLPNQAESSSYRMPPPRETESRSSYTSMFSPSTEDMRTVEEDVEYCNEYDDLRRTVGSNDYDDMEEIRDGPECLQSERQALSYSSRRFRCPAVVEEEDSLRMEAE